MQIQVASPQIVLACRYLPLPMIEDRESLHSPYLTPRTRSPNAQLI